MTVDAPCRVFELRQYTLHAGQRDVLIELFDRELVESQEAQGMRVVGQFRHQGAPNKFVWLRGFADMDVRAAALTGFYDGPVWRAHRGVANATMRDSNDVLLLRPLCPRDGFAAAHSKRPPVGVTTLPRTRVSATLCLLREPVGKALTRLFECDIRPALLEAGADVAAVLHTEYAANTFVRLPVREGEHALVWFTTFGSASLYEDVSLRLLHSRHWTGRVLPELGKYLKLPLQTLVLEPTARSLLR